MKLTADERIAELEREVERLSKSASADCVGITISMDYYNRLLAIKEMFPILQAEYNRVCAQLKKVGGCQ